MVMVLSGFVLNFSMSVRSDAALAKANIAHEQKYAIEQLNKHNQMLEENIAKAQETIKAMESVKAASSATQDALDSSISELNSILDAIDKKTDEHAQRMKESGIKSELDAKAFLVVWQSSLEEDNENALLMSKQDVEKERDVKTGGVSFYHTLSRVFTQSGLITYAQKYDKGVTTVSSALKVLRDDKTMIVLPIY